MEMWTVCWLYMFVCMKLYVTFDKILQHVRKATEHHFQCSFLISHNWVNQSLAKYFQVWRFHIIGLEFQHKVEQNVSHYENINARCTRVNFFRLKKKKRKIQLQVMELIQCKLGLLPLYYLLLSKRSGKNHANKKKKLNFFIVTYI